MKKFTYTITDPAGIHARPAGLLVKQAQPYASSYRENKAVVVSPSHHFTQLDSSSFRPLRAACTGTVYSTACRPKWPCQTLPL